MSIPQLLKSLGKTQEEQAAVLGIDRSLLSHILCGRRPVSIGLAAKICDKTGAKAELMPSGMFKFSMPKFRRRITTRKGAAA